MKAYPRHVSLSGASKALLYLSVELLVVRDMDWRRLMLFFTGSILLPVCFFSGCHPRVEVAVPDKPININLNVKIEHEVKIKVEKDLENQVFSEKSGLF